MPGRRGAGNRHLRRALYMPALSASAHEPHLRGFYQHLAERRGLLGIQTVCVAMRKLLTALRP